MTCIVGYADTNGDIYIGGDSIGYSELTWSIVKDPKVFIKEDFIFGFATSFRMGQILKYSFNIPEKPTKKMSDMQYLCKIFIPELIKKFDEEKFSSKSENGTDLGGTFLLGYNKHLYVIDPNFQVLEDVKNYEAIGCGEDYAKGALYVMEKNNEISAYDKVIKALEAAAEFSMVKPPFKILKI